MVRSLPWGLLGMSLLCTLLFNAPAEAQNQGQTVRRHRVAEDENYVPALAKAEAALEAKDYATAEQQLKSVVASQPGSFRAWFNLGLVYGETNRPAEAIEAYRKASAADPKSFESQLNLGLLLAQAGAADAEQHLRAATELQPASANPKEALRTTWLALAQVLERSKPQDALRAYQRVSALQPTDPRAHLAAGAIAEQLQEWKTAEDEYRAAQLADPQNQAAVRGLVSVYLETRQYAKAEPLLRGLLDSSPQDRSTRLLLGRLLVAQGKSEEALAELEAELKDSQNPDERRGMAQLYIDAKQYAKATEQLQFLVGQTPNDPVLRAKLGTVLLQQGRYPEAQQELLIALKLKPDMAATYADLALAASENKEYELAIRALDARARMTPDVPATYFLRAIAYDHLKDPKNATENYKRFLEVADGKYPDQEWQARHRLKAIEPRK